jgi:hypothetical protein
MNTMYNYSLIDTLEMNYYSHQESDTELLDIMASILNEESPIIPKEVEIPEQSSFMWNTVEDVFDMIDTTSFYFEEEENGTSISSVTSSVAQTPCCSPPSSPSIIDVLMSHHQQRIIPQSPISPATACNLSPVPQEFYQQEEIILEQSKQKISATQFIIYEGYNTTHTTTALKRKRTSETTVPSMNSRPNKKQRQQYATIKSIRPQSDHIIHIELEQDISTACNKKDIVVIFNTQRAQVIKMLYSNVIVCRVPPRLGTSTTTSVQISLDSGKSFSIPSAAAVYNYSVSTQNI